MIELNNGQGVVGVGVFNVFVDKDIQSDNINLVFDIVLFSISWLDMNVLIYCNEIGVIEVEIVSICVLCCDFEIIGISVDQCFVFDLGCYESVFMIGGEYYEDIQDGGDSVDVNGICGGVLDVDVSFMVFYVQLEMQGFVLFGLLGEVVVLLGICNDSFEMFFMIFLVMENDVMFVCFGVIYVLISDFNMFVNWGEVFCVFLINEFYIDGMYFLLLYIILGLLIFIFNEFIVNLDLMLEEMEMLEIGFSLDFVDWIGVD